MERSTDVGDERLQLGLRTGEDLLDHLRGTRTELGELLGRACNGLLGLEAQRDLERAGVALSSNLDSMTLNEPEGACARAVSRARALRARLEAWRHATLGDLGGDLDEACLFDDLTVSNGQREVIAATLAPHQLDVCDSVLVPVCVGLCSRRLSSRGVHTLSARVAMGQMDCDAHVEHD